MSVVYPLALPTATGIAKVTFRQKTVVALSVSPFTGQQQVQEHSGQWWEADVSLPVMTKAQARAWIGFLTALNGVSGTFNMGDPSAKTPQGSIPGTPVVAGAGQTGRVLATSGWTASQTGILKAGDYIQLGTGLAAHLHIVETDANSDGSGAASLDIWPALRVSPGNGDALIVTNTVGLFRLAANEINWNVDEAMLYGLTFAAREAI